MQADALAAMEKHNNVQFDGKQMHIYVMLPKGLPALFALPEVHAKVKFFDVC